MLVDSRRAEWEDAINSEIKGLLDSDAVKWVPESEARKLPGFCKPLPTRYVFRIKKDEHGRPYKYKARLVVRGDLVAYDNCYAPTTSYNSVRILLSIAAAQNLDCFQVDVSQAFLQAPIKQPCFIYKPPIPGESTFVTDQRSGKQRLIGVLGKSLYGLPSSPKAWYDAYTAYVKSLGYHQLSGDSCLFVKRKGDQFCMTTLFVDDALVVSSSVAMREKFVTSLAKRFPINASETGHASCYLGSRLTETALPVQSSVPRLRQSPSLLLPVVSRAIVGGRLGFQCSLVCCQSWNVPR